MHYLFIYPSPGVLGGIETLLARTSRWLIRDGHQVTLLLEKGGDWTEILPKEAKCIVLGNRFRELYYYFHARRLWKSLKLSPPDVIKSFDLPSSWMACQLGDQIGNKCKVLAGIYNPLIFKWYYSSKSLPRWDDNLLYLRNYLKHIPASSRVFCGVDQIEELEEIHHEKGSLWPIPIDTSGFEPAARKPKWGKIVSVGRLSPMKEYNLYMIDVVSALRKRGHDVTWWVYGTGKYEAAMREQIKKQGLEEVVKLEGHVAYERFWKVLEEAYVFVGMGTAVLEAALFKVPNVNALAYDRAGLTHGPVYRFPPGSIGPGNTSPPNLLVVDEIERILRLDSVGYQTEADLVYRHAREHEMEVSMEHFQQLVRNAGSIPRGITRYLANYPLWFIRQFMKPLAGTRKETHPSGPLLAYEPKIQP